LSGLQGLLKTWNSPGSKPQPFFPFMICLRPKNSKDENNLSVFAQPPTTR